MRYADSHCEVVEAYKPEHTYTFVGPCVVTGKEVKVTVKAEDLFRYRQGAYAQDAFPYLSPADREFLISGMSGEGWDMTFGSPEDEQDDS
jgi:hypothetical protein